MRSRDAVQAAYSLILEVYGVGAEGIERMDKDLSDRERQALGRVGAKLEGILEALSWCLNDGGRPGVAFQESLEQMDSKLREVLLFQPHGATD